MDLAEAALVLLGHGSTRNAESAAPVYQHATELRARKVFAEVREAFWKQEPQVKPVLVTLTTPWVFIVPLFISEGYFSNQVIPRELGFVAGPKLETQNARLCYCKPVGTHDRMTGVVLGRARDVAAQFPFPRPPTPADTTLFIAGHGTDQDGNSRLAIDRQVELIRAMNAYAAVHGVFLEEEPQISECHRLARTKNLVVVPFFISDGMHAREDIPVLLGEPRRVVRQRLAQGVPTWHNPTERNDKLIWYTPAIGTDPRVADVILERVREVAESDQLSCNQDMKSGRETKSDSAF